MTTDTQQQTAETAKTETAQVQSTEKEITLDDVYRDAGLDKVVASETRQDTQQTQSASQTQTQKIEPSSIPDPYDAENFKAFQAGQAGRTNALEQAVKQMAGFLSAKQQQEAMAATRADIDSAVKALDETVALGKPKVIESYLDAEVRTDPRLKALWENRAKNPGAWQKALGVVGKKMAEEFSVKVDPALVAAQRARKDAQKQMATTSTKDTGSPDEERLAAATGAAFDREWESYISAGN